MNNRREKRRRKEIQKADAEQKREARQRRALRLLKALDLWDVVRNTSLKQKFLESHYPDVEVVLDEGVSKTEVTRRMECEAQRAASNARFDFPLLGKQFLIGEYFSAVKPILDLIHRADPADPNLAALFAAARARVDQLASSDIGCRAFLTLGSRIEEVLIRYGRFNSTLYALKPRYGRNEWKKWFVSYRIVAESRQTRILRKDGKPRSAFRCGQPYNSSGVDWVEWRLSEIGIAGEDKSYPVFVQSHALEQLYSRMSCLLHGESLLHDCLWRSLKKPTIAQGGRQPEQFLVEYHLRGFKLGYIVVSRCEDAFLVDTFLFLTMNGTPEGDQLWKKLRLTRDDKRHLGLDRIDVFLGTDIQADPMLVTILDACGCGHLFRFLKNPPKDLARGYADEMRRYLRLDSSF